MLKIRICIPAAAARKGRAALAGGPLALCSIRLHRLPVLRRSPFALRSLALILLAGVLALPVLAVLASWLPWGQGDAQAGSILREMAATVLPGYVGTTLWLSVMVALGAALVGTAAAAAATAIQTCAAPENQTA